MNSSLQQIVKIACLGLLPIFLLSSSRATNYTVTENLIDLVDKKLVPKNMVWTMEIEEDKKGISYRKMNVSFLGDEHSGRLELHVRDRYEGEVVEDEIFMIHPIDGFLEGFEGVFGIYTDDEFGEAPFFAHNGYIRISNREGHRVRGYLDVTLRNNNGETIRIADAFHNF